MAAPARGKWTVLLDSEVQRKTCKVFGISALTSYQVEALYRSCMLQQAWHAGVCADCEQKIGVFRRNVHRDQPRHWWRVSSLVHRLWLARYESVWRAPPVMLQAYSVISGGAVAIWPEFGELVFHLANCMMYTQATINLVFLLLLLY